MRSDDLATVAAAAVHADDVVNLTLELARRPSPAGAEEPRARWLRRWLIAADVPARCQRFARGRANVLVGARRGPTLAVYGHLDTSLHDDPDVDRAVTGRDDPPRPPEVADGTISGLGVGVATAPTAGVLVALVAARTTLTAAGHPGAQELGALVVAGGTHRAVPPPPASALAAARTGPTMGIGVHAALDAGFRPGAVLSCKGGAPGPLYEEPGTLYLAVTVHDRYGSAIARPESDGLAGAPGQLIDLIAALASWRTTHLQKRRGVRGQLAADVALGAVSAGLAAKPDLLPSTASAHLSIVTLPGDDETTIADELRTQLGIRMPSLNVTVEPYGLLPPGHTDPAHPLVDAVAEAWRRHGGAIDVPIRRWRGSTDGALLRSLGVPTVRLGPSIGVDNDDLRRETVDVDELVRCARAWADAATSYVVATLSATSNDTIARSAIRGRKRSATNDS